MSEFIAALPMYDWPEMRAEVDAQWAGIRDRLRASGIDAPKTLVRRNSDMPAVPGGIEDAAGKQIAPDPASLPPDELDLATLWRHPRLLFAQACWGPLEEGLSDHVRILAQPDYSGMNGGHGIHYASAILIHSPELAKAQAEDGVLPTPADGSPVLPLDLFRGARLAFNSRDSMSGMIGLLRDLAGAGEGAAVFAELIETRSHRGAIQAVAAGDADVCAIDCRIWDLAQRHEPASRDLAVVGWTSRRLGLPYISAKSAPEYDVALLGACIPAA